MCHPFVMSFTLVVTDEGAAAPEATITTRATRPLAAAGVTAETKMAVPIAETESAVRTHYFTIEFLVTFFFPE